MAGAGDAELLRAVGEGRVEALRELHVRHAPWLRLRLSRRCADPDLVDDAIQDTFVAIWRGAKRYRQGTTDPAAWIWTIAIRRLVSATRRRSGRWIGSGGAPSGAMPDGGGRGGVSGPTVLSAEDMVLLGVQHGDLGAALARLSPELRAAIQATVLDGLTVREAARLLGIPEGTVKTRVMRAKAQLRRDLI
ncbi:RNA polymerase sigma factor [Streptosporangiaceae bacterium NEAU-GS5]|nr:RNA polymerase sigma factor [Streptosporangiaceae bacterium NEAU-GS5]